MSNCTCVTNVEPRNQQVTLHCKHYSQIDEVGKEIADDVKLYWCMERNVAEEITEEVLDTLIKHGILNPEIKTAYLKHL